MKKSLDDRAYLFDIIEACENVESFIQGMTYESFEKDLKTNSATQQQIMIMGEAAGKISDELRSQNSSVPWKEMIGVRNVLVHGYMSVDLKIVWKIASAEIGTVKLELKKILSELDTSEESQ